MTKEGGQDCHKNAKETGITHLLSYNVVPSYILTSTLQITTLGRTTFLKYFQMSSIQREQNYSSVSNVGDLGSLGTGMILS